MHVWFLFCTRVAWYDDAFGLCRSGTRQNTAHRTSDTRSNRSRQRTETCPEKPAPAATQTPEERLDKLFADLRRTTDEAKARRIASQINTLWSQSGSATVDLLMQWANAAMLERRYPSAIDFLNEAIALDPEYAEAWNRRATVYFLQKTTPTPCTISIVPWSWNRAIMAP